MITEEGDRELDLLSDWSRLGILWNVAPSQRTPDVEMLIVRSLAPIRRNARLLVLAANWLRIFWRCVGRDRLLKLALDMSPREQATLAIILESVDAWLPVPIFHSITAKLAAVHPARPLFEAECTRPELARLAEIEASDISRRRGLWCMRIEPKTNAIRPVDWVLETNPNLRLRALFKGSLKTSVIGVIATAKSRVNPTILARECGATRKAVYAAIEDLQFAGALPLAALSDTTAFASARPTTHRIR